MRKFLITAAILSVAAAATPAAAQYDYGRYDRGYGQRDYDRYDRGYGRGGVQIERQLERLHDRIDRAADRGRLSRGEAFRLQHQFDNISRRYTVYRRDGLSNWEYQDLQRRIDDLRSRFQFERQDDRYGRDYRW